MTDHLQPSMERHDNAAIPAAAAIMVLAAALRMFHIDQPSLWNDELFSRYYAGLFGLEFLFGPGLRLEPTPPLYYLALDGWIRLFGDSAAALRSLSVVASIAAIPLIWKLGREFGDTRRALLGCLLFALSPIAIYFAQEARVYSLLLLPAAGVLLAVARFLRTGAVGDLAWYVFAATLGLYCHPTFAFLIGASALAVTWFLFRPTRRLVGWILANVVVGVFGLPELLAMASGASHGALAYIPALQLRNIASALSALVSGPVTDPIFPGFLLAATLLAALTTALWARLPARPEFTVVVVIPTLFVALVLLASLKQSMMIGRVLLWLSIPLSLALARGLLVPSRVRPVLAAVTAITLGVGLSFQIGFADSVKEPWRDVLGALRTDLVNGDLVVLGPSMNPVILLYYAPEVTHRRMWDDGGPKNIENDNIPDRLGILRVTLDEILAAIQAGQSVWLVANGVDQDALPAVLNRAPPPAQRVDRRCGRHPCVTVLGWGNK
jgi:hypothetical protein